MLSRSVLQRPPVGPDVLVVWLDALLDGSCHPFLTFCSILSQALVGEPGGLAALLVDVVGCGLPAGLREFLIAPPGDALIQAGGAAFRGPHRYVRLAIQYVHCLVVGQAFLRRQRSDDPCGFGRVPQPDEYCRCVIHGSILVRMISIRSHVVLLCWVDVVNVRQQIFNGYADIARKFWIMVARWCGSTVFGWRATSPNRTRCQPSGIAPCSEARDIRPLRGRRALSRICSPGGRPAWPPASA